MEPSPTPRTFPIDPRVTSLIDGKAIPRDAPGTGLPVIDPTTEAPLGVLREADASEVDAAVQAARRAFDEGPWPRMDINARKDILYAIRDHLRRHAEELAWLECKNVGLPMRSVQVHVQRMARNFEFFAEVASTAHGETYTQTAGYLTYVETQLVQAVCGPVGDCNAVQSSSYARLFGVLPVGVLGASGVCKGEQDGNADALEGDGTVHGAMPGS